MALEICEIWEEALELAESPNASALLALFLPIVIEMATGVLLVVSVPSSAVVVSSVYADMDTVPFVLSNDASNFTPSTSSLPMLFLIEDSVKCVYIFSAVVP